MIDLKAMYDLFNPCELYFMDINDLLDVTGLSFKDILKIDIQSECSKSIDESCMNFECDFNYINMHDDETYVEVFKEVEQARKEVEKKIKEDMKRIHPN